MKRAAAAVFLAAFFLVPAIADGVEPGQIISMDGLGPVKIGMKPDQLSRALMQQLPYNQYANHGCSAVTTQDLEPMGVSFVIDKKRLVRVSIDFYGTDQRPSTFKTDAGIGLGSSEEDVRKAYPNAEIKANPSDPSWHTIVVNTPDQTKGLVFETNGKTVKSLRGGENPAVAYASGCE